MAAASKRESKDDNSFSIEKNNEFDRIKALLEKVEGLRDKKRAILKEGKPKKILAISLKTVEKEIKKLQEQVIMVLKHNFKHIYGMWPSTAHFKDENHRMEHWQTSLNIKRRIFDPSKRLIECKIGADAMQ